MALFFAGLVTYFDWSNRKPELLPALAGCFRGTGLLSNTLMVVFPDGRGEVDGRTFETTVTRDKEGLSFFPKPGIVFDSGAPSRLQTTSSALLLRLSSDRTTVTIPGDPPGAHLIREACPSAGEPSRRR